MSLVTMLAVGFAYCAHMQRTFAHEQRVTNKVLELFGIVTTVKVAPHWLVRLIGNDNVPEWYERVDKASIAPGTSDGIRKLVPYLREFQYLDMVFIEEGGERPVEFSLLQQLPDLKSLNLNYYDPLDPTSIGELKALKQLEVLSPGYSPLTDSQRRELQSALPNCRISE
ncbi:MAG: hypothetical protein KDA63_19775 [Planctomycetales bacterium]|nr:hypothetical protein [Planctomycetales bacterium]